MAATLGSARLTYDNSGGGGGGGVPGDSTIRKIQASNTAYFVDQIPATADTPLRVVFGESVSEYIYTSPSGELSINTTGNYNFNVDLTLARNSVVVMPTLMLVNVLIDDVRTPISKAYYLYSALPYFSVDLNFWLSLNSGQVVSFEIMRDSGYEDSGGLFPFTPTNPDWPAVPSASINVDYWPQVTTNAV